MRFLLDGQLRLMSGERSSGDTWRGARGICQLQLVDDRDERAELELRLSSRLLFVSSQPRCSTRTPVAASSLSTRLAMAIGETQLSTDSESSTADWVADSRLSFLPRACLPVIPSCYSCIYRNNLGYGNGLSASQFAIRHELLQSKPMPTPGSAPRPWTSRLTPAARPSPRGDQTAVGARMRLFLAIDICKHAAPLSAASSPETVPQPELEMAMEQPPPLERPRAYSFTFAAAASPAVLSACSHAQCSTQAAA